jgi:hypothetical protein
MLVAISKSLLSGAGGDGIYLKCLEAAMALA